MKTIYSIICIFWAIWFGYLFTQRPRLFFGLDRTGIALLKGDYRSWTFRWCDGWIPEGGTKMTPFCDQSDGTIKRGYRLIPKFTYTDAGKARAIIERQFPGAVTPRPNTEN